MRAPDALGIAEAGPTPWPVDYGLYVDSSRLAEYEADWYRWRAIRRDAQMTNAERDAWLGRAAHRQQTRDMAAGVV